jgi:hypothetical protein
MLQEAKETGIFSNPLTGAEYPKVKIAYVKDFFEKNERFVVPVHEVTKKADLKEDSSTQHDLELE